MGYRRSKETAAVSRKWTAFVAQNQQLILATGLLELIISSVDHWNDFLMHGYLDHHIDPGDFTIDKLSEQQYINLVKLVESYFASGYDYFETIALRSKDRTIFNDRFDKATGNDG